MRGQLTRSLLAFARRQSLAPQATDLAVLLTEMQPFIERTMGGMVTVAVKAAANAPPALINHQIESAVLNLAINARDAMAVGGQAP